MSYEQSQTSGKLAPSSSELELVENSREVAVTENQFIFNPSGLFPVPLGKSTKSSQVTKVKNRFKLLGKFMAKALYDSRMVSFLVLQFFVCGLASYPAISRLISSILPNPGRYSIEHSVLQVAARSTDLLDRAGFGSHRCVNRQNHLCSRSNRQEQKEMRKSSL